MFFNNPTLTDAGRALIIKALAGETITFSKLGLGNGVVPADVTPLTELVNPCVKFGLTSITTGVGGVSLSGSFDNSSIEEDFVATELGIYAIDPDDGEILYALARPYCEPTTIPAGANSGYGRINLNVVVAVGDAENVTAIISEFIGYASTRTSITPTTRTRSRRPRSASATSPTSRQTIRRQPSARRSGSRRSKAAQRSACCWGRSRERSGN